MAEEPGRSTLPLPDHDRLPLGSLERRVRCLTAEEVGELIAHERTHADRVPVTEVLTGRLRQLQSGARPAPGGPRSRAPGSMRRARAPGDPGDLPAAGRPAAARHAGPAGRAAGRPHVEEASHLVSADGARAPVRRADAQEEGPGRGRAP
ncbi:hypothetical protein [Streptomyces sp. NPDC056160]|uniref:hypothetical protein n=1 Tax=Streptomyces sp. NPDC056160 TaxID=3345731 RepID=UPI0035D78403